MSSRWNKISNDKNPKHSFSKKDDIRMLSYWLITQEVLQNIKIVKTNLYK